MDRQADRQTGRRDNRQTDKQTDRQRERETDRQTGRQRVFKDSVSHTALYTNTRGMRCFIYIFGQFKICISLQQSNSDIQMFVLAGNKKSSSSILDKMMKE